ncbi:hypothetical protein [Nocardiopsis sp. CNT312]|uniref:hypothetical protein n=1 Tax=Nocardiopsis sp. CNT312 TaxID=1137268 RepID=UPI0004BBFFE6|nr:hypothetical protein [Nocardiopsis sp. CNT312]
MAWHVEDDRPFYATARRLQHAVGSRWVVLWGPASRRYWALPCGTATAPVLSDPDPDRLYAMAQRQAAGRPATGTAAPAPSEHRQPR